MKDRAALFYVKDGKVYPVALTEEQNDLLQMTATLMSPLKIIMDRPLGNAINLASKNMISVQITEKV